MLTSAVIGLAGSAIIAAAAWRIRALSLSGSLAAVAVGTTLFVCGSAAWYGALLLFFVTSTFWSKWRRGRKKDAEAGYEKGGRRDAAQVLANGGLAALLCAGNALSPDSFWVYAFCGVIASVTADTWATEIGALSKGEPRLVTSGRKVPRGTSGGISAPGTAAAAAGAATIGGFVAVVGRLTDDPAIAPISVPIVIAAILGGVLGALFDSLLGATVQQMRQCRVCGAEVERAAHCNTATDYVRGWRWMNNDAVNAVSSIVGGMIGMIVGSQV